jgi:hypothetical protein
MAMHNDFLAANSLYLCIRNMVTLALIIFITLIRINVPDLLQLSADKPNNYQ